MPTITYPAARLGPPRSKSHRNTSDHDRTIALVSGLGMMAIAGAASVALRRPSLALAGLMLGMVTTGVMIERASARR